VSCDDVAIGDDRARGALVSARDDDRMDAVRREDSRTARSVASGGHVITPACITSPTVVRVSREATGRS
jgi:hypothetical protein